MSNREHYDPQQCARAAAALHQTGTVVELRVLGTIRGTVSGYFDDLNELVEFASVGVVRDRST